MNQKGRLLVLTLIAVSILAGGLLWFRQGEILPVITPDNWDEIDSELAATIKMAVQRAIENPHDVGPRYELGMIYEANTISALARESYLQVVEINPQHKHGWYRLAVVNSNLGWANQALTAGRRAAKLAPEYAPAYWRLGQWLLDAGQIQDAEIAFRTATKIDTSSKAAWFGIATVYLITKQPEQTVKIVQEHLLVGQYKPRAYQLLGRAYQVLGQMEKARDAISHSKQVRVNWKDPWSSELSKYRQGNNAKRAEAEQLFHQEQYARSIKLFEELLSIYEDDWQILTFLGIAYFHTSRHDDCKQAMQRSLTINKDNDKAHYYLALLAAAGGNIAKADIPRAIFHINRSIEANDASAKSYRLKGALFSMRGDFVLAANTFKKGFRSDSRDSTLLTLAGLAECQAQQWESAIATLDEALLYDPDSADAHVGRARALLELGSIDEAELALNKAKQLKTADRNRIALTEARLNQLRKRNGK